MKRFLLLVLVALIAAVAIWYGVRVAERTSAVAVTSLLPGDTLFLAHMPDFNRTRAEWHQTDLYQISREPAVRDFLQKPLSTIPKSQAASRSLAEFERLDPKDVFFAVTSSANAQVTMAGGFRFKGNAQEAEKVIGQWRAKLLAKLPAARRESVEYERHHIETVVATGQTIATVYDRDWFLVANDLLELKAMIDRADGRVKDRNTSLAGDVTFAAAFKHMPSNYATLIYGRLDRYLEKLKPLLSAGGMSTAEPTPLYRQIHAFCGAFAFDGSKVRDVLFIGMPKLVNAGPLSRASLALGTRETFFYLASLLNLTKQMYSSPTGPTASGILGVIQKFAGAVSTSGLSLEEWNAAFGPELGMLGDWPAASRSPAFIAALPVKDRAKATQILEKVTTSAGGATWIQQEKDGIRYLSTQPSGLFSFAPTLALTDKMLVAGSDAASVEAAVKRSASTSSEFATSQDFRSAEKTVPSAKNAFFYLDPALLYTRLDATLRPMLLVAAAFVPAINQKVDLSKFPPSEVITKHLSPIVMSQNYRGDGYVTESVGPVTMYQAVVAIALIGGGGMALYQHQMQQPAAGVLGKAASPATPVPAASATGSPSPTPIQTP